MVVRGIVRVSVVTAGLVLCPGASADDLAAALGRCAAIPISGPRLACYDGLAAPYKPATSTPAPVAPAPAAASVAVPAPVPQALQSKPEQFGSEALAVAPETASAALDSITATVRTVRYNPLGRFTVTLDNGQVWQQSPGDSDKARFPKDGAVVTITRGALGSYNLTIGGAARLFKVNRIQ